MIKNACGVLKNGDKIFKSQVVDSYLRTNTTGIIYISTYITGLTTSAPLYAYNQTPSGTIKCTYTSDPTFTISFPSTGEGSQKLQYFCGNLDGVRYMRPYTSNNVGCFGGDLPKFASQFLNLDCLDMAYREVDFNQNISYSSFPESLRVFYLFDKGIQGDVATVCGIENVECWKLCCTAALSGNFHGIKTTALKSLCVNNTSTALKFDFNCLSDNNPNYTYSCLYNIQGAQMCADTMNMENFTYVNWYAPVSAVKGDFSNWCFNTGLTYYCTTFNCVQGDLTNWNIPETKVTMFSVYNQGYYTMNIGGSLSGWTMPSTLTYFSLSYTRDVTSIPNDYSGSPNLYGLSMSQLPALSGDITTFIFPNNMNQLTFSTTQMCGNLENFVFPTGITSPQLVCSNFTGNLSGITLPSKASGIYLYDNCLSGNVVDFVMPSGASYVNLSNSYLPDKRGVYFDLNKTFDTKNIYSLSLNYMTGVTGSFNNMIVGDALLYLYMCNSNISADLNELDLNNIQSLVFHSSNVCQDITPMFTGTTNVCQLYICQNPNMSGDTTNWQVDNMRYFVVNNTALSGRLCHSQPYWMCIQFTDICSCIDTDFDFSVQSYYITMNNAKLQGSLSNVNLNYNNIQQFYINGNSSVCGANEFADKIFVNRKNFCRQNTSLFWYSISDNVTGATETLGDLGTWGGSEWDLTEAQVNNLAAGTDYTGSGTNTPWNSKEKMYWVKNALNPGGATKRYVTFNISYN